MAVASAAALICDTGALLDYLVATAPDHRLFRSAIEQARARYVPGLVLAEVDYFLRYERGAMQMFMQDLARGAFTYAPPTLGQLARAMEIDRRYSDLGVLEESESGRVHGVDERLSVENFRRGIRATYDLTRMLGAAGPQ